VVLGDGYLPREGGVIARSPLGPVLFSEEGFADLAPVDPPAWCAASATSSPPQAELAITPAVTHRPTARTPSMARYQVHDNSLTPLTPCEW